MMENIESSESATLNLDHLRLIPHSSARTQVVASHHLSPGSIILSTPALTSALVQSEKGLRCDGCHSPRSDTRSLRKCSGCNSYWYCGIDCQNWQWKAHHKFLCKSIQQFLASREYQCLTPVRQLDSIMLSHLIAEFYPRKDSKQDRNLAFSTFLSLMEGNMFLGVPPVCPMRKMVDSADVRSLYARFGNNNFSVQTFLSTYAHGVFPLASRLFNHSCVPNASVKFIINSSRYVTMNVVALSSISENEEVCLTYLDPAMLQARGQILPLAYGFSCTCPSCLFLRDIGEIPNLPKSPTARREMEKVLRQYVFPGGQFQKQAQIGPLDLKKESFPKVLYPVLQEPFVAELSRRFYEKSHEEQLEAKGALETGLTLLAFYMLIYPHNYSQIGVHLLEMAKLAWNASTTIPLGHKAEVALRRDCETYFSSSQRIFSILGLEDDGSRLLLEIRNLQNLLRLVEVIT